MVPTDQLSAALTTVEGDKMAEEENVQVEPVVEEEEESTSYKPPPEKSLQEMIETDKEDESLRKYKETLLGSSAAGAVVVDMLSGGYESMVFSCGM
ncbi:Rho GDP-dissociation inhibitor 1 [Portunus trituberculatus]|uniref:Rho GDP-dissociation inhibitor 1 n=1 Tax=Portunus trituberculatus TaxID=210409 RepID=A0A5B7E375_PORTR|nr:Rho GDP-dissociation inhibitor 1 [Portunus trituberculatus]